MQRTLQRHRIGKGLAKQSTGTEHVQCAVICVVGQAIGLTVVLVSGKIVPCQIDARACHSSSPPAPGSGPATADVAAKTRIVIIVILGKLGQAALQQLLIHVLECTRVAQGEWGRGGPLEQSSG